MSSRSILSVRTIAATLGAMAVLYGLACLGLWYCQTRLIFFPSRSLRATPADAQLAYEEVWLPVDGGQVHGWWIPARATAAPVLLYLHGNASNLGDLVHRAQRFHQWGYGVLLIDYRGYGRSSGPFPSETRVYEDGEAGWRYLTEEQQIAPERLFIYGRSIGGAIAVHLGKQHPEAAGLILESPFTSMRAMAERGTLTSLVPVDWLLTQRFDSLGKARSLQSPVLLLHGTADATVPPDMGQTLYEAIPDPKSLVWIEGAGHNDIPQVGGDRYGEAVQDFVGRYAP